VYDFSSHIVPSPVRTSEAVSYPQPSSTSRSTDIVSLITGAGVGAELCTRSNNNTNINTNINTNSNSDSDCIALPQGAASTGISGLQWNFRAWQIVTTIKELFPSGTNAKAIVCDTDTGDKLGSGSSSTSWRYTNIDGHILTKASRDDDDESGVGYEEVEGLVRGMVKDVLPLDLPARKGFDVDLIEEVFRKISYGEKVVGKEQEQEQEQEQGGGQGGEGEGDGPGAKGRLRRQEACESCGRECLLAAKSYCG
jgi:hypothetical protein